MRVATRVMSVLVFVDNVGVGKVARNEAGWCYHMEKGGSRYGFLTQKAAKDALLEKVQEASK